jgi:hypothetical protein
VRVRVCARRKGEDEGNARILYGQREGEGEAEGGGSWRPCHRWPAGITGDGRINTENKLRVRIAREVIALLR